MARTRNGHQDLPRKPFAAEGSYIQPAEMGAPSLSRMTNDAVAKSSKTKTASGSRMTNSAISNAASSSELTIGNQQIEIPAGTPVILIAPTTTPLSQDNMYSFFRNSRVMAPLMDRSLWSERTPV
jgi:hypothetical protein